MPDFSSTHSTTARSGGWWYRPTTSTTFSAKNGSVDSLKVPAKCGLRSNLRQIRPIVDLDSPLRCAIEARDQCVASAGISSRVAVMTSSTLSSRIDGGRPGRGSSCRPSSLAAMNRPRQRPTVDSSTPRSAATCLLVPPSAHASTIFARSARYWAVFARRAHRTSWARSAPVSTSPAFGCPIGPASSSPASRWPADLRRHLDTDLTPPPRPRRPPQANLAPPHGPRLDRHPQLPGNLRIRRPLGARQDDPGPVSLPAPRQPRPPHQLSPLTFRQHDLHARKTSMRHTRRLAPIIHRTSDAAY